jgi:hypothetical protein
MLAVGSLTAGRSLFFDIRHDPQANTELNRTSTQFKYLKNKIEPPSHPSCLDPKCTLGTESQLDGR